METSNSISVSPQNIQQYEVSIQNGYLKLQTETYFPWNVNICILLQQSFNYPSMPSFNSMNEVRISCTILKMKFVPLSNLNEWEIMVHG
jgi:hypothetical protein